ncbi:MAG: hypothetical protein ACRC3G_01080 [Bacteroidales bacterium]
MDKDKETTAKKESISSTKKTQPLRRLVVSYKNLTPELLDLLKQKYPQGWNDHVMKINKSATDFFYAVMLETPDTSYLIKVDVKIDSTVKDDDEDTLIDDDADQSDDDLVDEDEEDIDKDTDKDL